MTKKLCISVVVAVVILSQTAAFAGLRAAWNFEDQAPSGITADVSGVAPAMNATGQGTYSVTTDPDRGGYVLDPTGGTLTDGKPVGLGGFLANSIAKAQGTWESYTLSLWVKPQADANSSLNWSVNEQWKHLAGNDSTWMDSMSSGLLYHADMVSPSEDDWWKTTFQVWKGSAWDPADAGYDGTGPWHHLLVTFDGDKLKGWVDGVHQEDWGKDPNSTRIALNTSQFGICWVAAAGSGWRVDDVALFKGYIDDANVIALYNGTKTIYNVTAIDIVPATEEPPADKLVFWYRMDEAPNSTILKDYSANCGPRVVLVNGSGTPDPGIVEDAERFRVLSLNYNTAYKGDTAEIKQAINPAFLERKAVTVTFWAKTDYVGTGTADLISTIGNGINVNRHGNGVRAFIDIDNTIDPGNPSNIINSRLSPQGGWDSLIFDNEWHHFAVVFDANLPADYALSDPSTHDANAVAVIYVDGALIARDNSKPCGALWSADESFWLLEDPQSQTYYTGMMDDIRRYAAVLTPAQIQYIYQTTAGIYDGLAVDKANSEAPSSDSSEQWAVNRITNDIRWNPGKNAATQNVYFRKKGDASWTTSLGQARTNCSYDPAGDLLLDTVYEWKVDEVNGATTWPGATLKFKTVNYMVLDDFETYTSDTHLRTTWKVTGSATSPGLIDDLPSEGQVPQGSQAVKMSSINLTASPYRSMYYRTTTSLNLSSANQNIKAMKVIFKGDIANKGTSVCAYLKSGTVVAMVQHPDTRSSLILDWTEWNIALSEFTAANPSINLAAITEYGVGVGTGTSVAGFTTGTMYFDGIMVFQPRCLQSMNKADITGDCKVDINDIDAVAYDWLDSDTSIGDGKLVALWRFEDGVGSTLAQDKSGYSPTANGELKGAAAIVAGDAGRGTGMLSVTGLNGTYVDCNVDSLTNPDKFKFGSGATIAMWLKTGGSGTWKDILNDGGNGPRVFQVEGYDVKFGYDTTPGSWANGNIATSTDPLTYNTWKHVACVIAPLDVNGPTMRIYVDGVKLSELPCSSTIVPKTAKAYTLGHNGYSTTNTGFFGKIDDVAIYNRALTAAEITQVKNATTDAGFTVTAVPIYQPVASPANVYKESLGTDKVNFKDYSIVADRWLEIPSYWP